MFVYLSGPITAREGRIVEDEEHVAAAAKVYFECLRSGIVAFCPHLSGAFPSAFEIGYDVWIEYDYAIIDRCTHLLMLPGWKTSRGALLEHQYALDTGKGIFESLDDLHAYLHDVRTSRR